MPAMSIVLHKAVLSCVCLQMEERPHENNDMKLICNVIYVHRVVDLSLPLGLMKGLVLFLTLHKLIKCWMILPIRRFVSEDV